MPFKVVLDACVLYPFSLRDTLLRLAEAELYDLHWSDRILDEMTNALIRNNGMPVDKATRLEAFMRRAFEDALVPAEVIAQLEPAMTNDPGDRHVLSAAVGARAELIITANLRHFAPASCEPLGITATHPDEFLIGLYQKRPQAVREVIEEQAADLDKPPQTARDVLDHLAKSVPRFVALYRAS